MNISYKARKRLARLGIVLAVLFSIALTIYTGWVVWAGRYIIYTRDGARLDLSVSEFLPEGTPAAPPSGNENVSVIYQDPIAEDDDISSEVKPTNILGYYIDLDALKNDISTVRSQLEALPDGTAVMLDMKNIRGEFYYQSTVGSKTSDDIDPEQMDRLLEYLHSRQFHVIARIPAFRDREYGLNNVPHGLAKKGGGGSLWMDDQGCYWLNPGNEGALGYLVRELMELKGLGFDEVVFTDFRFPNTEKIVFDGDREQTLIQAAQQLVQTCASSRFFVSFYTDNPAFPVPEGNSRIYLEGVAAADLHQVVNQAAVSDPKVQLLFITDVSDTRFNDYCVLRPLESAH